MPSLQMIYIINLVFFFFFFYFIPQMPKNMLAVLEESF